MNIANLKISNENIKKHKENQNDNSLNIDSIIEKFTSLIITALGVCTALAWNEAFQNFFKSYKILVNYGPWVYATSITLIALISMVYIHKLHNLFK